MWSPYEKHKSWKRVLLDTASLYMMSHLNRKQARAITGTTAGVYGDFMKAKGRVQVVEELGEDARLFWYGPRKSDRVLLYFHGMWWN